MNAKCKVAVLKSSSRNQLRKQILGSLCVLRPLSNVSDGILCIRTCQGYAPGLVGSPLTILAMACSNGSPGLSSMNLWPQLNGRIGSALGSNGDVLLSFWLSFYRKKNDQYKHGTEAVLASTLRRTISSRFLKVTWSSILVWMTTSIDHKENNEQVSK